MPQVATRALHQEVQAKQILIEQLRALADHDPDVLADLFEGETNLIDLIAAVDASILEDEILVEGTKIFMEKQQARKKAAEARIDAKRRLLGHTLDQIGLKTLRTPTSTLTISEAGVKAIAIEPAEIPARWWRPQPPKPDQEGLTRAIRARKTALTALDHIPDPDERDLVRARIDEEHPAIPGVAESNGGITLTRRV